MSPTATIETNADSGRYLTVSMKSSRNRRFETDGPYSWLVAVCALILWLLGSSPITAFGVFYVEFLEVYHGGEVVTSWILACHMLTLCIMAPFAAECAVTFGYRKSGSLAAIFVFLGFLVCYFARDIRLVYFAYGALVGIGGSMFVMTAVIATQFYFRKYISVAMGIAGLGSSIGALVVPNFLRFLIVTFTLRGCLLILAAVYLQGLPVACLIRPIPKITSDVTNSLEETVEKSSICNKIYRFLRSAIDLSILKKPLVAIFTVALYMCNTFTVTMYSFTIARGISHGESKQEAVVAMTIFGACNVVGRLLIGWLGDRVNRMLLFGICTTSCGIAAVISSVFYTRTLHVVCCGFIGFAIGGYVILIITSIIDVIGKQHVAKITSINSVLFGVAGLVGLPLSGWIVEVSGSYDLLFLIMGTLVTCGGLIILSLAATVLYQKRARWAKQSIDINLDKI